MKPYPHYKPSGVAWLGDVPGHWEVERLRFRVRLNPAMTVDLRESDLVSFLPMEAIGEDGSLSLELSRPVSELSSGYTYFEVGDVAIAKITPCFENGKGAVFQKLQRGAGFGTTELIVMRPSDSVAPRWLYYLTLCRAFRAPGEAMMLGAGGQKRVPDLFVKDYRAAFPAREEQQVIADYLDAETGRIDALIREKDGLIELLEERRAAAFGTQIAEMARNAGGQSNRRFAWLSELPSDWNCVRIKHIVQSVDQGISPQCEARVPDDDEWGVLKVGCVNSGLFNARESKALPPDITPIPTITLQEGDVLVSRANTKSLVGRAAMAEREYPKLMLSDKLYRLKLDTTRCLPAYLVGILGLPAIRVLIEERATGASASMVNIDRRTILDLDFPLPPIGQQNELVAHAKSDTADAEALRAHVMEEVALLKELRAATIADAVLGRIDLRPEK